MNCESIKVMEINNRRGRNKIVGGAMFENFSKIYNRGGEGGEGGGRLFGTLQYNSISE